MKIRQDSDAARKKIPGTNGRMAIFVGVGVYPDPVMKSIKQSVGSIIVN